MNPNYRLFIPQSPSNMCLTLECNVREHILKGLFVKSGIFQLMYRSFRNLDENVDVFAS